MMQNNEIVVTIRCATYNHEPYIRQCLEGFVMQKTNFKFEAVVHDDASTDRTAVIIREFEQKYPDIIRPIYETENQYSKHDGSLARIMDAHTHGKYIAYCEGDDYWIDPYKLQKQVDFLEAHPEYGMCYAQCRYYIETSKRFSRRILGGKHKNLKSLMITNWIPTLTTLLRRDLIERYKDEIQPSNQDWLMGDLPMWIWFMCNSKMGFIRHNVAVYRCLEESASHSKNIKHVLAHIISATTIRLYFNTKYDLHLEKVIRQNHLKEIMRLYALYKQPQDVLRVWKEILCEFPIYGVFSYKLYCYWLYSKLKNNIYA